MYFLCKDAAGFYYLMYKDAIKVSFKKATFFANIIQDELCLRGIPQLQTFVFVYQFLQNISGIPVFGDCRNF